MISYGSGVLTGITDPVAAQPASLSLDVAAWVTSINGTNCSGTDTLSFTSSAGTVTATLIPDPDNPFASYDSGSGEFKLPVEPIGNVLIGDVSNLASVLASMIPGSTFDGTHTVNIVSPGTGSAATLSMTCTFGTLAGSAEGQDAILASGTMEVELIPATPGKCIVPLQISGRYVSLPNECTVVIAFKDAFGGYVPIGGILRETGVGGVPILAMGINNDSVTGGNWLAAISSTAFIGQSLVAITCVDFSPCVPVADSANSTFVFAYLAAAGLLV